MSVKENEEVAVVTVEKREMEAKSVQEERDGGGHAREWGRGGCMGISGGGQGSSSGR